MICKKCGAYNPDHATFCKVCAANLKDQSDENDTPKVADAEETVEKEFRPRRGNLKAPDFSAARRAETFKAAPKAEKPVVEQDDDEEEEEEEEAAAAKKMPAFSRNAVPANKRRIVDEEDEEDEDDEDDYEEEEVKPAGKKSFFSRSTAKKRSVDEEEDEDDEDYDEEDEDDEDDEEEKEEVKPARKKPFFARAAAPAKKRPVQTDDDEEDEDEDEDSGTEKLESEPKTSRFTRPVAKKRPIDDEDDEDDDDDGYEEEDEDYEEYEPTPPRRKKTNRSQSKRGGDGFNIVTLLIVCLLAILLIIIGIIAFCNIKGGATKAKLPGFLQFNCSGKAATEADTQSPKQATVPDNSNQGNESTDAPVTGLPVDYSATKLEEVLDNEGRPCVKINLFAKPGDTVTIVLPNQDDHVEQNNTASDQQYVLTIPQSCYYPNTPLTESIYTVTPQVLVTHADGTQESLKVDSFDIVFPTVQLQLSDPEQALIPTDGVMAAEDNTLFIKGQVDDHTVTVTVNGQPVKNMYKGGNFDYTYVMTGDEPQNVTIEAYKADYVSTSYTFTVKPYVFIPDPMVLNVESDINKLKADKHQKVVVKGTTVAGATLTATPVAEYQTAVVCGAPVVDADGNFSFEVTFNDKYYGIAAIMLHAKKEGYEEGEATCIVSRMYADQKTAVTGFGKTKSYHEVYKGIKFDDVMADPTAPGLYRFSGKVMAYDAATGVVTMEIESSSKAKATIYVLNASEKWEPDKHVGDKYFLYCTLNGLYTDGTSLYVTAWFIKKTK